jgi:hypothetical protein
MAGLLTLTISEKSELNLTMSWMPNPITMLFTLGVDADLSAQATRIDTLNFYYNVSDIAYRENPALLGQTDIILMSISRARY